MKPITFLNVPVSGVVLKPLPTDLEANGLIRQACSGPLLALLDDVEGEFDKKACKDLAKIMWKKLGRDFILKVPKEQISI